MKGLIIVFSALFFLFLGTVIPQMASAQGQNRPEVAQNMGPEDFQVNELDFDRQLGAAPPPPPPPTGQPAAGVLSPGSKVDDGLTDLFTDPKANGSLKNLPGEPSPLQRPSGPGEANIELSKPTSSQPRSVVRKTRRYRRSRSGGYVGLGRPIYSQRWYWATQAWRNHPEVARQNCPSYTPDRPLYHVKCFGSLYRMPHYLYAKPVY
ncbi:MAG: hypothetical protein LBV23_05135 [Deltaproteobacteria bacterium]|jgi:hypothetical protein|nr:hypothetical protein [Deltaproteobacteria bacterium]